MNIAVFWDFFQYSLQMKHEKQNEDIFFETSFGMTKNAYLESSAFVGLYSYYLSSRVNFDSPMVGITIKYLSSFAWYALFLAWFYNFALW